MAAPLGLRPSFSSLRPLNVNKTWSRYAGMWKRTKEMWNAAPPDRKRMTEVDHQTNSLEGKYFAQEITDREQERAAIMRRWIFDCDDPDLMKLRFYNLNIHKLRKLQKYDATNHEAMGHDITAAHLIVSLGGAVKFDGRNVWIKRDNKGRYSLPRTMVDTLKLEAIDARNIDLTSTAFENFTSLKNLRYLNISDNKYVDDWALSKLKFLADSLEFLDISNCPQITDNGLAALYSLKKLEGLKVAGLSGSSMLGFMSLLLEEHIEGLQVLGLTENDLKPNGDSRGERKLVKALLGIMEKEEESFQEEFSTRHTSDYPRRVHKVDWVDLN